MATIAFCYSVFSHTVVIAYPGSKIRNMPRGSIVGVLTSDIFGRFSVWPRTCTSSFSSRDVWLRHNFAGSSSSPPSIHPFTGRIHTQLGYSHRGDKRIYCYCRREGQRYPSNTGNEESHTKKADLVMAARENDAGMTTDPKKKQQEEEQDDMILTPRDPHTLYNFGPASSRDNVLFTCERPSTSSCGNDDQHHHHGHVSDASNEKTKKILISSQAVKEWVHFMKDQHGIDQVLVLLEDHELHGDYEDPGLIAMYEEHGLIVHRTPIRGDGRSDVEIRNQVFEILSKCHKEKQRIVTHCSHGQGRAGRIAAAWLTHHYGLSPEVATTEVLNTARQYGISRMGSPNRLRTWLDCPPLSSSPSPSS